MGKKPVTTLPKSKQLTSKEKLRKLQYLQKIKDERRNFSVAVKENKLHWFDFVALFIVIFSIVFIGVSDFFNVEVKDILHLFSGFFNP